MTKDDEQVLDSLYEEIYEAGSRLTKLHNCMFSPSFHELNETQQFLLRSQKSIMQDLLLILKLRASELEIRLKEEEEM